AMCPNLWKTLNQFLVLATMNRLGSLICLVIVLAACSAEKKASKAFRLGKYQTAIDLYKSQLERNPEDGLANYLVAEAYRLSNRIKEAEAYYAKAKGPGVPVDSVLFHYGQALKVNQKYTEARQVWERLAAQTEIEPLREHTERQIEAIDKLNALREKPSYYRVRNLEVLNTPAAEYAPFHLN